MEYPAYDLTGKLVGFGKGDHIQFFGRPLITTERSVMNKKRAKFPKGLDRKNVRSGDVITLSASLATGCRHYVDGIYEVVSINGHRTHATLIMRDGPSYHSTQKTSIICLCEYEIYEGESLLESYDE